MRLPDGAGRHLRLQLVTIRPMSAADGGAGCRVQRDLKNRIQKQSVLDSDVVTGYVPLAHVSSSAFWRLQKQGFYGLSSHPCQPDVQISLKGGNLS
jgi:hypothetical protein